ncbi:late secretory pathway protein AVL9-like [Papaver somniferum]|uniref:late secretory pathway protein AVL9-like n=1 Tax=Papaver somniferum TaxID=3469 RepID=UPI000E6F5C10|nr:late secretory pathway protein AVL9-like [Papaver somniferum]
MSSSKEEEEAKRAIQDAKSMIRDGKYKNAKAKIQETINIPSSSTESEVESRYQTLRAHLVTVRCHQIRGTDNAIKELDLAMSSMYKENYPKVDRKRRAPSRYISEDEDEDEYTYAAQSAEDEDENKATDEENADSDDDDGGGGGDSDESYEDKIKNLDGKIREEMLQLANVQCRISKLKSEKQVVEAQHCSFKSEMASLKSKLSNGDLCNMVQMEEVEDNC